MILNLAIVNIELIYKNFTFFNYFLLKNLLYQF